ncbi:C-terminal binding protein AN [Physcomitrium patens]|uniref:Angustifolia1-2 n=1 Tax=Physcomitrium patens TaxID=3218 RepID=B9WZ82_PHYPA|nr:C-terminal binding protein AN-like [Physcomitrium patens]XP_024397003.1 C-terminal binding protein AN-like [Physcomitrium patens]XP_024397004.1 C-terminal binding protein AN-like [Physcomitrium patens]PNR39940.1 hypothetical protein PHYPA_020220 [Physcomitrium patens]BAH23863.1 angustifolia1-2 [Physcomitrium patens]BAH23864.1 angustifolia1-2 [Physcomitrium patens]|eukprot:XP_024397002.1 C-terminal binding protein AN-like [Physcomitrella patens]
MATSTRSPAGMVGLKASAGTQQLQKSNGFAVNGMPATTSSSQQSREVAFDRRTHMLPLVVALNCLEDCRLEEEALAGIAEVRHVGLTQVTEGRIETAIAVLMTSLANLPGAAQKRLQPWQLILCLSSVDKAVDAALAAEMGLQVIHVDSKRVEEVADTTLALMLGLLRHTHVLARKGHASAAGWLGASKSVCTGMHRCKGLVLGIIGASATACAVAVRSLAFRMLVIYYDPENTEGEQVNKRQLPFAAKKVNSLKELLASSDVISLHCALSNETVQLINAEFLESVKPGAILVNTSSSHLLDDCAVKQAIINGKLAGCALDGVEGPHWLEAWVREMENVLVLPRSAEYSEEVWLEIRAKALTVLRSYLVTGVVPMDITSDDDEYYANFTQEPCQETLTKTLIGKEESRHHGEVTSGSEYRASSMVFQAQDPRSLGQDSRIDSFNLKQQHEGHQNQGRGSGKKSKKRSGRRKSQHNMDSFQVQERETDWISTPRNDQGASVSARDNRPISDSRFGSPGEGNLKAIVDTPSSGREQVTSMVSMGYAIDQLKEGFVVALHAVSGGGYYVARQRGPGRGWCLDILFDVTPRDPASQFLVVVRNRDRIGLRSLAAGGKLLQANKKLELVFVNHTFDVWESWIVEGRQLDNCSLTNSRFRSVTLQVSMEILAAVGEEDGIARWLS